MARSLTDCYGHYAAGLGQYDLEGSGSLLDVFAYEAQRLIRDRLVDADSKQRFDGMLASLLRSQWQHSSEASGTRSF